MQDENQATLLLLQRLIKAQPDAPTGQIANVLAQYSEAVNKDVKPKVGQSPGLAQKKRKRLN